MEINLKLAIDARTLRFINNGMGVERTLKNLLREWCSYSDNNKYFLISDETIYLPEQILNSPKIEVIICKSKMTSKPLYWENVILPIIMKNRNVDLLFSPAYKTTLTYHKIPKVVLIHDISYRVLKKDYTFKHRTMLNLYSFLSSKVASMVITDSNYSKSEIMKYYSVPKEKITSIYLGIEDYFFSNSSKENFGELKVENINIVGKYFLYIGTMFERRHIKELIGAYKVFLDNNKEYKLVLVGENNMVQNYDLNKELSDINSFSKEKMIYHFKKVSEPDLLNLYRHCSIFIYLSSYEGFGFPPLEAMAAGKPVITGDKTSIPEVVADGAMCINPSSISDVYNAIIRITGDKTFREELGIKGRIQAKKFQWDYTAKQYLKVFNEVIGI